MTPHSESKRWIARTILFSCLLLSNCKKELGPSPAKKPAEEKASFQLAPGMQIDLVAAEPMIQDPVAMTFDETGRLWVVEMRGFMPNIDGKGSDERVGRVSVLFDSDGDGSMDQHTVFKDSLLMPRAIAVVKDGALIAENLPLWWAKDIDGDLRADTMILIDAEYGDRGLTEHSPNGLWRGLDNWYYNAKSKYRYQLVGEKWIKEETEFRGQWGISHDDIGRLYYNYNWSQLHADLVPPNQLSRNINHSPTSGIDHGLTLERGIFPIRPTPAVNRGYIPGTLDENGKLFEFTSACAPLVYRGDQLGIEYQGNAFVCDPAANLIRRNIIWEDGFVLNARHAYAEREFLASTDERFRPVALCTGPDGALYIADMYRGIIQDGLYMTPYLKEQTLVRKLDSPINLGRIWRITASDKRPSEKVDLSKKTTVELLPFLEHGNGWYRDLTQRLLVESQDTSIGPHLSKIVVNEATTPVGRIHALWTLSGLGILSSGHCFAAMTSDVEMVKTTGMRLLLPFARKNPKIQYRLDQYIRKNIKTASKKMVLQMALSTSNEELLALMASRLLEHPLIRDAVLSSLENREFALLEHLLQDPSWSEEETGKSVFLEMIAAAIANKGDAEEIRRVNFYISQLGSAMQWQVKALANGLQLNNSNNDRITDTLHLPPLSQEHQQSIAKGRQIYLNICSSCHGVDGKGLNRFAPPLRNSEWVLGDEKRLALILLHGMEGPVEVNGQSYGPPEIMPVMPSLSIIQDADLAAVSTYIRRAWGHRAAPVSRGTVSKVRHRMQGKVQPWTVEELKSLEPDQIAEN